MLGIAGVSRPTPFGESATSVGERGRNGRTGRVTLAEMGRNLIRRLAIGVAAWLPFFILWTGVTMSSGQVTVRAALVNGLFSMGSAGLLGIVVWFACERWPWPLGFRLTFYALQIGLAILYGVTWAIVVFVLDYLRGGSAALALWTWPLFGREALLGVWFYAVFAGMSHAVQTRRRLHEKETLAARAEALATEARLEALRARLNPHFLFNALHTLAAVVKFRPSLAESAIERLGDMLRYTLKEDGRGVVEFSEEYDFTRQYLAFEQLRYEDRLAVNLEVDAEAFDFDVPPFSIQTLAENAVHHAIAIRPEGGSIWITCCGKGGQLQVSVRDDGPGLGSETNESHQIGLRSVRERLVAAFGSSAELRVDRKAGGFEASFIVPSFSGDPSPRASE
jgi:two-component system, LytTR family, sensor kinase